MPFDLYACYPRATLAASQSAYRRALAEEQMNHSDLALPAANVSPRLTTAESLALVLANHTRGKPAEGYTPAPRKYGSLPTRLSAPDQPA
jgi:hypothetical protein